MTIPNLVKDSITPDGKPNPNHQQMMQQLVIELQRVLSDEGIKTPQQSSSNITKLNTQKSLGALVYDSDNHRLMVNINGTFKTVTVS